jgi:hypothetical protein
VTARIYAVEYIRRMHGGSQSKLIRCSDSRYYVVKFQNNPQGRRILANELLATLIAKMLGLPVPEPAVVEVHPDLIRYTEELVIEPGRARVPCRPGLCFGSLYGDGEASPGGQSDLYDLLPEDRLKKVHNLSEFAGMLVFDKWTGNTDARQTIFVRVAANQSAYCSCRALMIDQGHCFNGPNWNFPDRPRHGLYPCRTVYANVEGEEAFVPWLKRLNRDVNQHAVERAAQEIPPEWYGGDYDSVAQLLATLDERRDRLRGLLWSTRKATREFFPAWLRRDKEMLLNSSPNQQVLEQHLRAGNNSPVGQGNEMNGVLRQFDG